MKFKLTISFYLWAIALLWGQQAQFNGDIIFMCPPCGMACDTVKHAQGGACRLCGMQLMAGFPELVGKSGRGHFQHIRGKKVAILIFDGVEIIDFAPEFEIFGQAGCRVFTVAERDTTIRTMMGLRILPDYNFQNAPDADIVILPGGMVDHENPNIRAWMQKAHERATTMLTVCNGAYFPAAAGLLDGQKATTFNGSLWELKQIAPKVEVVDNQRFVDNGKIVTSAGLASGMDAAFHILGKYEGRGRAQEVATFLEYNWDAEGKYVRAQLADRHLRPLDDALSPFLLRTLRYEGGRKQWLLEAEVTTELVSIEKIIRLLTYQWENGMGWKKNSEQGLNSQWTLEERNSTTWRGNIRVSPRGGQHYSVEVLVQAE